MHELFLVISITWLLIGVLLFWLVPDDDSASWILLPDSIGATVSSAGRVFMVAGPIGLLVLLYSYSAQFALFVFCLYLDRMASGPAEEHGDSLPQSTGLVGEKCAGSKSKELVVQVTPRWQSGLED